MTYDKITERNNAVYTSFVTTLLILTVVLTSPSISRAADTTAPEARYQEFKQSIYLDENIGVKVEAWTAFHTEKGTFVFIVAGNPNSVENDEGVTLSNVTAYGEMVVHECSSSETRCRVELPFNRRSRKRIFSEIEIVNSDEFVLRYIERPVGVFNVGKKRDDRVTDELVFNAVAH